MTGGRSWRLCRGFPLCLALSSLAWTACEGRGLRFLTGVGEGVSGNTSTGGSGITGTWRRTLVVQTSTDVITSETTWTFSVGGGCQRTVVSNSVLQGFPETQVSPCSYTLAGGQVTISYSGTSGSVSFSVSVSGNSLFLGGVQFMRIG